VFIRLLKHVGKISVLAATCYCYCCTAKD